MPRYYIPKNDFKVVELEEIKPYINQASTTELKVLIALIWLTGARIGDIIRLKKVHFVIRNEFKDIQIIIKASKFGGIGIPTFGFNDPFISDLIIPYLESILTDIPFTHGKRRYQQLLQELNKKIHGDDKTKWVTFHYFRHSRLSWLGQHEAMPEDFKSWTGHRSGAFEDYFKARRTEKFKGMIK